VLIVTFAGDIFCSRHVVHARGVYRNVVPYRNWEFMSSGVDHISASSLVFDLVCMCSTLLVGMYSFKLLSTLPYFADIARS